MIAQSKLEDERKRRHLALLRVPVGVALILASIAVVLSGVVAFREGKDAWLAMRPSLAAAILLGGLFAWIAKALVKLGMRSG
jgi:hypothetical protein